MKNNFDLELADKQSYDGELGAVYSPEKTIFRVWQPFSESAVVRIHGGGELLESISMKRVGGVFECVKRGDCAGLEYTFLITRNGGTVESPDPYSRAVTADGERSVIVDMNANKPENWDEQPMIYAENPVIYELSVRDFSMDKSACFKHRGKFAAFCESGVTNSHGDIVGLDYIKSLGVTHIQLMPVFDFDLDGGEYNWGYNPRFFNAPSLGYTQNNAVLELRELVAAVHRKGIGVVADVVYNHLYSAENSAFGRIFPGYYFRQNDKGEYSNGSGCGNEFASERKMAGKIIIDSLVFLANEYKLDGFRFDLMGLLDIDTLNEAEQRLRKINPNILLYGEGWTGGESALPEEFRAVQKNAALLPGFGFFNDSFRDGVKGSVFDDTDCGYVNGSSDDYHLVPVKRALTGKFKKFWTENAAQTVNYVECHDNLTLYDKLRASLEEPAAENIIRSGRMAAALTLLSHGISFIQAGQEFLRSKNGEHNSYNLPDSVNSLKWDGVSENSSEVEYYRGLIALRKWLFKGLTVCGFTKFGGGFMLGYKHSDGDFALIVNPTDEPITVEKSGKFAIYADSEQVSDKPIRKTEGLRCAAHSILFAEVKQEMMKRLTELRKLMNERGISAYIVCTDDFHGSEYVGAHFRLREYLSGFTGSAGTLVVLPDTAALWTDGRYFIQAERELSGSGIKLMKAGEKDVPTIEKYLCDNLSNDAVIGFDGRAVSALFAEKLLKKLAYKHVTAKSDEDLGGMVWEALGERPPLSREQVFELPESVCGLSAAKKIGDIRKKLAEAQADGLVISALDEIAWTLNLRGGDVDFNPVFLSFMAISNDEILLFAQREIFSEKIAEKLEKIGVGIMPYEDVYNSGFWLNKTVWLDSGALNFKLKNTIKNQCKIIDKKSPVLMMKAVKNPAEIEAIKLAHLIDGCVVSRFILGFKYGFTNGDKMISEISAAQLLEESRIYVSNEIYRRSRFDDCRYLGQSFAPIMAYGEHGAIVHYSATEQTNVNIKPRGLLLFDTGAHYLGRKIAGTTDITRTLVLGEPTAEEKRAYTIVLAAHLELLNTRFPRGTRGSVLDYAAREIFWKNGMNFNHGTGHGVGFLLNVHEGPQRISHNAANDPPFEPGMIVSCEPGYYVEGKFGVRHESLMLCVEDEEHDGFLRFEPLTMVPFDKKGIDTELLTDKQVDYLNAYHKLVYDKLSKMGVLLNLMWLRQATEPVKKSSYFIDDFGNAVSPNKETLLEVPKSVGEVYTVPDGITSIGDMAFRRKGIKRVILPDSVRHIGKYAFQGCTKLEEINLENVKSIGEGAFLGCGNLRTVLLGNGLEDIAEYAFSETKVESIVIPRSVKKIKTNVFSSYYTAFVEFYDSTDFEILGEKYISRSRNCTITVRCADSGKIKCKLVIPGENSIPFLDCFTEDHKFDLEKYDRLVAGETFRLSYRWSSTMDKDSDLVSIIAYRLKYPYKLTDKAMEDYFAVLTRFQKDLWEYVFKKHDIELLEILAKGWMVTRENIVELIGMSVEANTPELTAFLLNYKHEKFPDLTDNLDLK